VKALLYLVLCAVVAGCASSRGTEPGTEARAALPSPVFELRLADAEAGDGMIPATIRSTGETIYLAPVAALTIDDLADAEVIPGKQSPALKLTFTRSGARSFADLTEKHQGEPLAVIIGGEAITASVIRATITSGVLVLEGYYSEDEARRIAAALSRR
jgi:preprotein translocase subunit SecD